MSDIVPNKLGLPDEDGDLNPRVSPERKIEITGLLLMLLGLLIFLAVISNRESDYVQVSGFGFFDIITTDSASMPIVNNWLGIFGAILSHHLIYNFLGYPVVILSFILILWGWVMVRHHSLTKPTYFSLYGLIFNLLFSTSFGLITILSKSQWLDNAWSGLIGVFIASVLHSVLGAIGSILVVLGLLLAAVSLFINLNLRQSVTVTQNIFVRIFNSLGEKIKSLLSSIASRSKKHSVTNPNNTEAGEPLSQVNLTVEQEYPTENESTESTQPDILSIFKEDEVISDDDVMDQTVVDTKPPKEAENRTGILTTKNIGIPIEDIKPKQEIPLEDVQPLEMVEQSNLTPLEQPTEIFSINSLEDELIPIKESEPESLTTSNEPEGEKTKKRSENLATYLRSKLQSKKADESSLPENLEIQNEDSTERIEIGSEKKTEKVEEDILTDSSTIDSTTILEEEHTSVVESNDSENLSKPADNPKQETANQVDLEISIVEEKKAILPKDPIFQFGYKKPNIDLLKKNSKTIHDVINQEELEENKTKLIDKLRTYGIEIDGNMHAIVGPRVTLYEFKPAAGIKVSRIVSLADDIALAMAAKGIRIMAPVPGKAFVGVEIPNRESVHVLLREVLESEKFKEVTEGIKDSNGNVTHEPMLLPIALGKTIDDGIYIEDLAKLPHLLIAGTTGSGKSVGINTIICSLLYFAHPEQLKFAMIDPKRVELSIYRRLERHFLAVLPELDEPIITDTSKAITFLRAVEREMDQRYDLLSRVGMRNLKDFNRKIDKGELKQNDNDPYKKLPYLVVIIDELADLMMTAGKEVEEPIARIAQLARAVGIHLVVATQRPSVDVITGMIKANFPARIAYQVMSRIDSRTILDMNGADQLLGNGDMLYLPNGSPKPIRIQNAFVSTDEADAIINHIAKQPGYVSAYRLPVPVDKNPKGSTNRTETSDNDEWDELLVEAAHIVVQYEQGSTSLLQRRLRIGYSRAARIIDQLEMLGIVGPPDGSKARQVTVQDESMLKDILDTM